MLSSLRQRFVRPTSFPGKAGWFLRHHSSVPPKKQGQVVHPIPPTSLTKDMAYGIQDAVELFVRCGVGHQKFKALSKESGDVNTLVSRWQQMMEAFLGTQLHVLSGLGYNPNESGLQLYNQHVAMFMQNSDPDTVEELRIGTRDTWREVLSTTFNVSTDDIIKSEMSVVEARNTMHKVSQKMQDPQVLELIAKECGNIPHSDDSKMNMALRHQVIQSVLVNDVYLGGNPSLVEECGYEKGEQGYVKMQCVLAEHQNDPMVGQYIGTAMRQILLSAGIDINNPI